MCETRNEIYVYLDGVINSTDNPVQAGAPHSLTVYPNPATDNLNLMVDGYAYSGSVRVFDTGGKTILREQVKGHIDLSGISSGTYFIEVKIGSDKVTKKIVKY